MDKRTWCFVYVGDTVTVMLAGQKAMISWCDQCHVSCQRRGMLPLRESHAWKLCRFRVELLGQFCLHLKTKLNQIWKINTMHFCTQTSETTMQIFHLWWGGLSPGQVEHQATVSVWNVSRTPGGCGAGHIWYWQHRLTSVAAKLIRAENFH